MENIASLKHCIVKKNRHRPPLGGMGEENKWEAGNKQSYPPLVGVKGKVCKVVQELDAGSQLVHVIMMVII